MTKEALTLEERKQKMIDNIRMNYRQVEKSIVDQLYMKHDLHGTTIGSEREDIWRQLFEMIIPKKFVIEQSVFIIDSEGRVSHEVDLAILDETYTPYIFRYGRIKFIPIEAVAVVVECKSQRLKEDALSDWHTSIADLKTAGNAIARIATMIAVQPVPTQQSTRPIRILCALKSEVSPEIAEYFDFTLLAARHDRSSESGSIEIDYRAIGSLLDWYANLNFYGLESEETRRGIVEKINSAASLEGISLEQYEVHDKDSSLVSLLTFNFQLNQLLMLINNPILFPHRAYAHLFDFGRKES